MKMSSFSLLLVLFVFALATSSTARLQFLNEWGPVVLPKLSDPKVIKMAEYGVSEYAKITKYPLEFISVVHGEQFFLTFRDTDKGVFQGEVRWYLRVELKNCSQLPDLYYFQIHEFQDPTGRNYLSLGSVWK